MEKINDMNQVHLKETNDYDITDVIRFQKDDVGRLLLRLSIGGLMLVHGINKILFGTEAVTQILARAGLPPFFSFGVFIGEVLAPVLLIIGYKVRLAGFLVAINMVMATLLVHSSQLDEISEMGGWMVELNALYFFGAVAIIFLGSGHIAISKGRGALD